MSDDFLIPEDEAELRAFAEQHHVWEASDNVSRDPDMTRFRRRARLQQALWREKQELPIGEYRGRTRGNFIELERAKRDGANFLSDATRAVVAERVAQPEKHQAIDENRLFSNMLSSMPMCFNLFGELSKDPGGATKALGAWLGEVPGTVGEIRFEWSPGRIDPTFLGNRSAFDCAFLLDLYDAGRGVVGIETKYHEVATKEPSPKEQRLDRYYEVTEESGAFKPQWRSAVLGTELQQIWLDHLLALSMLRNEANGYRWARFLLVYPAKNISFARAVEEYRAILANDETFRSITIEDLLDSHFMTAELESEFRERYLW